MYNQSMNFFGDIVPFVFGSIIGSFLNVCIFRIPEEKSIVSPGSHCPECGRHIAWYDNIPILSYFILAGKCRQCKKPIPVQYPLVEGLTAVLAFFLAKRFGFTAEFLVFFVFTCSLIVVSFIDLRHFIIPDLISIPGIFAGILASWFLTDTGLKNSLLGFALGFVFLFVVAEGYRLVTGREGMGGGDVKLIGMIGAFTGWQGVLFTIFGGSLTGIIVGSIALLISGKDSKTPIPFGPFLSLSSVVYVLIGNYYMQNILFHMNFQ